MPHSAAQKLRHSLYVSASTKSVSIVVAGLAPIATNVGPSAPGCRPATGGYACTTTILVSPNVPGTQTTFTVTAFDGASGTGNKLSAGTVSQSIVPGNTNNVNLALDGIIAKLALAVASAPPPEGSPATIPITVMAQDSDANTIIGPDDYNNPIAVTDGDPTGDTQLSVDGGTASVTAALVKPSATLSLIYNGKPLSSAGGSASITAAASNVPASAVSPAYFVTSQADWATWGDSPSRGSYNPSETTLTPRNVSGLHQVWSRTTSGILNAQAIVAANIPNTKAGPGPIDVLYAGDERGMFYALNAGTGAVLWSHQLATQAINHSDPAQSSCTDQPGGVFGVSSAAQIDRSKNLVYTEDGAGNVVGFDLASGAQGPNFGSAFFGPNFDHSYGALNLDSSRGLLYAVVGAKCALTNDGAVVQFNTTSKARQVLFPGAPTNNQTNAAGLRAGVWGPGGAVLDPAGSGDILFGTADGPEGYSPYGPFGASIVRLNDALQVVGWDTPIAQSVQYDYDFGDSPLVFQPTSGCPGKTLLIAGNKDGQLFLFDANAITNGPLQAIAFSAPNEAGTNLPTPAYDPQTGLIYVNNGSDSPGGGFPHGLVALRLSGCSLSLAWSAIVGPNKNNDGPPAPPTVANGVVYYADGPGNGCSAVGHQGSCNPGPSHVYAFDAASGQQLAVVALPGPLYIAPTVVNGHVYVVSWGGFGPGTIVALGL